ncbi:FAD dependent oxidoreductase [Macrophomina phaseolina MS6]|uniref:FAD dependent oxidoreductase n=1 Tax=Macrophomina phaseolina (strain MS6) TaxID=1126212 RepID=K2RBV9_MACPH|nr:FAD dependent oxidoreductase [Macrophomina phaseolina MS6]
MSNQPPSSVLIIGSGVFGLTTAYSLATKPGYAKTKITVVDRQSFPANDSSSIDTSRIIRPDYADPAYSALAYTAQDLWRTTEWGASGRYTETGLALTADASGSSYVDESFHNVVALEPTATTERCTLPSSRGHGRPKIEELKSEADVRRCAGTGGTNGVRGYVNWTSGWADAEACMRYLYGKVQATQRVQFVKGTVARLDIAFPSGGASQQKYVRGAHLADGRTLSADLTVVAAGAWSPALLDLRGIVHATGQTLAYVPLSASEQAALGASPTVLNLSTGMFCIPPSQNLLKLARHGHGYANPVVIPHPEEPASTASLITVSLPRTHLTTPALPAHLPREATRALQSLARTLYPPATAPHDKSFSPLPIASRPFSGTRLCYYADTREGDFLITYHPSYARNSLFVATGGSGHGFKFLPVIGDKIVSCIEGRCPAEFAEKWAWPAERVEERMWEGDGSRGGPRGMVLDEEYAKGGTAKL